MIQDLSELKDRNVKLERVRWIFNKIYEKDPYEGTLALTFRTLGKEEILKSSK